jgi:hypothetical protein
LIFAPGPPGASFAPHHSSTPPDEIATNASKIKKEYQIEQQIGNGLSMSRSHTDKDGKNVETLGGMNQGMLRDTFRNRDRSADNDRTSYAVFSNGPIDRATLLLI